MIYKLAILGSILFIVFILNLVRKNKIEEKYSLLWLFLGIIILIVSIFPIIVEKVASMLDVYYPPALLLLFGFGITAAYIVHITIVITRQNKMIIKLTQELAILNDKVEKYKKGE